MSNVRRTPQDLREVKEIRSDSSEMQNMKATVSQKETQTSYGSTSESIDSVSTTTNSLKAPPAKKDDHVFKVPALPSRKKDDHVFKVPALPLKKKNDFKVPQAPGKPSVSSPQVRKDPSAIQVSPYPPCPPYSPNRRSTRFSRAPTVRCVDPFAAFIEEMIEENYDEDDFSIVSSSSDSEEEPVSNLDSLPKAATYNYDLLMRPPPPQNQFTAPEDVNVANTGGNKAREDDLPSVLSVAESTSASPISEPKTDVMMEDELSSSVPENIESQDVKTPGNTSTAGPQEPNANTSNARAYNDAFSPSPSVADSSFASPIVKLENDAMMEDVSSTLVSENIELHDVNTPGSTSTAGPQEPNANTSDARACNDSLSPSASVFESSCASPIVKLEHDAMMEDVSSTLISENIDANTPRSASIACSQESNADGNSVKACNDALSPSSSVAESSGARHFSLARSNALFGDEFGSFFSEDSEDTELQDVTSAGGKSTAGPHDVSNTNDQKPNANIGNARACNDALLPSSSVADGSGAIPTAKPKNRAKVKRIPSKLASDDELHHGDQLNNRERRLGRGDRSSSRDSHRRRRSLSPDRRGESYSLRPRARSREEQHSTNDQEPNANIGNARACNDALSPSLSVAESSLASPIAKLENDVKIEDHSSALTTEITELQYANIPGNTSTAGSQESNTNSNSERVCNDALSPSSSAAVIPSAKSKDRTKMKRIPSKLAFDDDELHHEDQLNNRERRPGRGNRSSSRDSHRRRRSLSPDRRGESYSLRPRARSREEQHSTNDQEPNANIGNARACNDALSPSPLVAESSLASPIVKLENDAMMEDVSSLLTSENIELHGVNTPGSTSTAGPQESSANSKSVKACNDALSASSSVAVSSSASPIAKPKDRTKMKRNQSKLASDDNELRHGDQLNNRERRLGRGDRSSSRDSHRRRRSLSPDRRGERYSLRSRTRSRNEDNSTNNKGPNENTSIARAHNDVLFPSASVSESPSATPIAKSKNDTMMEDVSTASSSEDIKLHHVIAPGNTPTAVSQDVNSTNTKAHDTNTSNTEACNDILPSSSSIVKSSSVTPAESKNDTKIVEVASELLYEDTELHHVNKKNTNTKARNANKSSARASNDALLPSSSVANCSGATPITKPKNDTKTEEVSSALTHEDIELHHVNAPRNAPTAGPLDVNVNSTNNKASIVNTNNTKAQNNALSSSRSAAESSNSPPNLKPKDRNKKENLAKALTSDGIELHNVNDEQMVDWISSLSAKEKSLLAGLLPAADCAVRGGSRVWDEDCPVFKHEHMWQSLANFRELLALGSSDLEEKKEDDEDIEEASGFKDDEYESYWGEAWGKK